MYNLLVSGNEDYWEGDSITLEPDRCAYEYTDDKIKETFGELSEEHIAEIMRFPCLFAYEKGCKKDPKFGRITEIVKRRKEVRIKYEIIPLDNFITHSDIEEMYFELDIYGLEMYRSHWAIKNVNISKELLQKKVSLPEWASTRKVPVNITNHIFEVSLSFPGEARDYIENIIPELEKELGPDTYFYDNNYQSQLSRPSLDLLLQNLYEKQSNLIVVFLSDDYQNKMWCNIEFRAIRNIIAKLDNDKIMFVRMEECDVDGVFEIDGYIDAEVNSSVKVAGFIIERVLLNRNK